MKKFLHTDSILTGLAVGLGIVILSLLLVVAGLSVAHQPLSTHLRLLGLVFIPLILALHYYAKRAQLPTVTKTLIVLLFILFLSFMYCLFHTKTLTF